MKRRFGPMAALFCMLLLALHGVAVASSGNTNPTTGAFTPSSVVIKTNVGSSTSVAINLFDLSSPPLTIDTITISGAQATDFSLSGSCAPGAVVNRSVGPCALKITFTPGALGARTATINATFVNAPSLTVPVSGEGIAPDAVIHVSFTAPLDFGSKPLGLVMTPVTRSDVFLQISNTGGSLLTGSTTLIGANPGDFALAGISTKGSGCVPNFALSPQNLPCNLPITFLPTAL